jgi:transposase
MRSRPNLPLGIKRTQAVGAPIGAAMRSIKTPTPENTRLGQQFEAWIGLMPKDHSTAGRVRLGVIARADDESLHGVPVAGAMAVIKHLPSAGSQSVLSPGLGQLLKHKPPKPAAMVPANRAIDRAGKVPWRGEMSDE